MISFASTPDEYVHSLPPDQQEEIETLRKCILSTLPKGFEEVMQYGMIGYVVPHTLYPPGYHCKPSDPLPFLGLARQKNHITLYHMGLYSDSDLLTWFQTNYSKSTQSKLNMGKCCIRWKKLSDIPFSLIAELVSKITPEEWIKTYKKTLKNR